MSSGALIAMGEAIGRTAPNGCFVNLEASRQQISTPALLLDLDAFGRNLNTMRSMAQGAGVNVRPHAKAHKSIEIARRQIEAGAVGISCATLGEAEILAAAGLPGVLITSPVVTPAMIDRLIELPSSVMVVVEDDGNFDALEAAFASASKPLGVLIDVDVGQHRTGIASSRRAVDLARRIAGSASLQWRGIQAYWGHLQQVLGFTERRRQVRAQAETLRTVINELRAAGLPPDIVTGGGTGTASIDAELGLFTEVQPGSYVFMDSSYGRAELWPDGRCPFATSLFVRANVVSAGRPEHAVINAGLKSFAADSGLPVAIAGAPAGTTYRFMGDEHGALVYAEGTNERLKVGDGVELVVSHCDPTVNLFDFLHCVRGDRLVDIWRIDARGR
jgi:D-serine deaminase-like pyridoxal phosphate-dependent protein